MTAGGGRLGDAADWQLDDQLRGTRGWSDPR